MGSVPPELSWNFRPTFVPKTISSFLNELSLIGNVSDKVSKLVAFVKRLEEEMKKIDAFKRELPLCMLLLRDAIVALKEELVQYMPRTVEPVLEEFIPLKNKKENNQTEEDGALITEKKEKDSNNNDNCYNNKDKKNWMSSVQLWNTDEDDFCSIDRKLDSKRNVGDSSQGCKNKGGATVFMPFKVDLGFAVRKEEKEEIPLTFLTPGIKNVRDESCSTRSRTSCSGAVSSSAPNAQLNFRSLPQPLSQRQQQQQQTARKQRRCWSPELHRQFINALQQLGGSQVATPKQIRELMQVNGLTNDEVKSHLQKYRLHTRRLPLSTTSPANQSVVLGSGLWMSEYKYGESSKGSSSLFGSPQGPLQLDINTTGNSTPGGDSMEDDEDAKSESYSSKGNIHKPGKDDVERVIPP
ncbi:transcription factor HHO6-like isoform X2 [Hibiscus syriacus]|uniref:transcription factor HHO6-like isoform X2 n=1 Tax=Hibiscus syriacus TaxID=106335 RepID=UPI001920D673|nr:transcription factor HHO6-like isoform X2 [Hibiscus syriacus]